MLSGGAAPENQLQPGRAGSRDAGGQTMGMKEKQETKNTARGCGFRKPADGEAGGRHRGLGPATGWWRGLAPGGLADLHFTVCSRATDCATQTHILRPGRLFLAGPGEWSGVEQRAMQAPMRRLTAAVGPIPKGNIKSITGAAGRWTHTQV